MCEDFLNGRCSNLVLLEQPARTQIFCARICVYCTKGATLGTPFKFEGKSHVLVLFGRKMRGRRVLGILVENLENAEILMKTLELCLKEIFERGERARK